jgi:hypothetical protein
MDHEGLFFRKFMTTSISDSLRQIIFSGHHVLSPLWTPPGLQFTELIQTVAGPGNRLPSLARHGI